MNTFLPTITHGLRYDSVNETLLRVSYGVQVCPPSVSGVPIPVPDFLPGIDEIWALTGEPSRIFGIFPEMLPEGTVLSINSCDVSADYMLTHDYYLCVVNDATFIELSDGRVMLRDVSARYLTIEALEIIGYGLVPAEGFGPIERDDSVLLYVSDNLYPQPVDYSSAVSDESDLYSQGASLSWPYASLVGFTPQEEALMVWGANKQTVTVPYANYPQWRVLHNDFTPIYTYKGLLEGIGYACTVLNVQNTRTLYVQNAGYFCPTQTVDIPGATSVIAFRAKKNLTKSVALGNVLSIVATLPSFSFIPGREED